MSRFRESAMIEPEPVRAPRDRRGGGWLSLLYGLVVGLAGAALWLGYPEIWDGMKAFYAAQLETIPEERRDIVPYALGAFGLLVIYAVRGPLLGSKLPLGAALGVFLWIPFGNHMLALAPQVEEQFPELRANLQDFVTSSDALTQVNGFAEQYIPVPGQPGE